MIQSAYIHIPFCQHICHYCDFNKMFIDRQPVEQYLDYLEKEIENTVQHVPFGQLQTIFVGGGTPTALNMKQTERLLAIIDKHLRPKTTEYELTFEANPGDVPKEKLKLLIEGGVNRLSFGVQTFQEELLKKLGRTHTKQDVVKSVEDAKAAGFFNINLDLIYALPTQTIQDVRETLQEAYALDVPHFSAYSLIVEPKTVFYNMMQKGKLPLPSEEHEAQMYEIVMDTMEKNGYYQYEISNFSKAGYESRHNLTYWNNEEYYGFGAGAHGYTAGKRTQNAGPLKKYFTTIDETDFPYVSAHPVTKQEQMEEELFLGLRKTEGVSKRTFLQKFGLRLNAIFQKQIEEQTRLGLIEETTEAIRLTRKGKLLGNEVFQSFLIDES